VTQSSEYFLVYSYTRKNFSDANSWIISKKKIRKEIIHKITWADDNLWIIFFFHRLWRKNSAVCVAWRKSLNNLFLKIKRKIIHKKTIVDDNLWIIRKEKPYPIGWAWAEGYPKKWKKLTFSFLFSTLNNQKWLKLETNIQKIWKTDGKFWTNAVRVK